MGKVGNFRKFLKLGIRGQASILIGLMMMTFILFFVFVVNTGMLINAKINLQNAADMAAYAGAAVQARQLTHISYLNYEMRRQYKKFLFRYYVIGGMAQKSFDESKAAQRQWYPEIPDKDFGVPTVCMIWEEKDNFCQISTLPKISIPKKTPLDRVNETLRVQLTTLENIRTKNCNSIGLVNQVILGQWLWNTDPDMSSLMDALKNGSKANAAVVDIIRGISFGLGLIPQELLLKMRIDSLSDYINFEPQADVNLQKANSLSNSTDPAARERTIQAFFSAYRSLGTHAFPADEIFMDEILPKSLVRLIPIQTGFDAYFQNFTFEGSKPDEPPPEITDPDQAKNCASYPELIAVPDQLPLGVIKDPQVLTYYAVRLRATTKVLFSPFGDMQLKAYAAAQPFGSRIGPAAGGGGFVTSALKVKGAITSPGLNVKGKLPNLPVQKEDSVDKGWNQNEVIRAYFNNMKRPGTNVVEVSSQSLERAYQTAMAPNPFEAGKYNIINDLNNDAFFKPFTNSKGPEESRMYAFWAPLIAPDREALGGGAKQVLEDTINELLNKGGALGNITKTSFFDDKFKQALIESIGKYVDKLKSGTAVTNFFEHAPQGFNIAQLNDPFTIRGAPGSPFAPIHLPATLFLNKPLEIKTSWNEVKDADLEAPGRNAYSVKFVSFQTLIKRIGVTSNGSEAWSNLPPFDSDETRLDLGEFVQH